VPKSLLAVDDSVTMRKVIEMTFAGEDLRVSTVPSAKDALASIRKERPDIVLADLSLEGYSGYDLCRAIKDEFQKIPVIILSSKQNPYDAAKGQAAGADAQIDKPYDSGKCIELVKKVLSQGASVAPAAIAAQPAAGVPAAPRAPVFNAPVAATPAPAPVAPLKPVAPAPHAPATLAGMAATAAPSAKPVFSPAPIMPKPPVKPVGEDTPITPAPTPVVSKPIAPPFVSRPTIAETPAARVAVVPHPPTPPAAHLPVHAAPAAKPAEIEHASLAELAQMPAPAPHAATPAAPALPPEMAAKLQTIGLTPAQVEAVLALSREIVEQVVWEVVPVLAETLIKEEIARLTK
jgi:CheY-like chemotaxis protein